MSYLCVNFNSICRYSPKSLKLLHPENQEYLRDNRWPPVWYLKDFDYYQRCMKEQKLEMSSKRKGCHAEDNGCLCFSGGEWSIQASQVREIKMPMKEFVILHDDHSVEIFMIFRQFLPKHWLSIHVLSFSAENHVFLHAFCSHHCTISTHTVVWSLINALLRYRTILDKSQYFFGWQASRRLTGTRRRRSPHRRTAPACSRATRTPSTIWIWR